MCKICVSCAVKCRGPGNNTHMFLSVLHSKCSRAKTTHHHPQLNRSVHTNKQEHNMMKLLSSELPATKVELNVRIFSGSVIVCQNADDANSSPYRGQRGYSVVKNPDRSKPHTRKVTKRVLC